MTPDAVRTSGPGYTGARRHGFSALAPRDLGNRKTVDQVTRPCPTCGKLATLEVCDSYRPDGHYRVEQIVCPSVGTVRRVLQGASPGIKSAEQEAIARGIGAYRIKKQACPVIQTETKIGDAPMPSISAETRDRIHANRIILGKTVREVADEMGLPKGTLGGILSGSSCSPERLAEVEAGALRLAQEASLRLDSEQAAPPPSESAPVPPKGARVQPKAPTPKKKPEPKKQQPERLRSKAHEGTVETPRSDLNQLVAKVDRMGETLGRIERELTPLGNVYGSARDLWDEAVEVLRRIPQAHRESLMALISMEEQAERFRDQARAEFLQPAAVSG